MLKRLSLPLILLMLFVAGGIMAQLQQSGGPGSSVSINAALPAGNNVIGHVIVDTAPSTVVTNANLDVALSTRLKPADTLAGVTTVAAVTAITNALPTGSNVIGHVIADSGLINTVPKTACGNTLATGSTLQAVPTSATLLTSAATACIVAVAFFNTNATSATVTLTDNTATPINAMLTFSIPANSNVIEPLHGGAFNLGVKWTASGTGVTGYVVAYQ